MEHKSWFNFSYGAITGNDCEPEQAIKSMREMTLDCARLSFKNSDRDDLYPEKGYSSYEGGIKAISPRETSMERGNRLSIELDGYGNGNVVVEPTRYLREYWMARYYGFLTAPATTDPFLISVNHLKPALKGAKPYSGPDRPESE